MKNRPPRSLAAGGQADADQVQDLVDGLTGDDLEERLQIICILGQMGDARALAALPERMTPVNKQLHVSIVAVGAPKRRLHVKLAAAPRLHASRPCAGGATCR